MRHFPIFLDTRGQAIFVSGAGNCAIAKLRLLMKTEAQLHVFGCDPEPLVRQWAAEGRLNLTERRLQLGDLSTALLLYAANDDFDLDQEASALGRAQGVKTLIVDNLEESDFITPAIVDRSPVTVAIGTEGTAPVLARKIKADIEEALPAEIGTLAKIGKRFRPLVAQLPFGRLRREFWTRYYFNHGPKALAQGEQAVRQMLQHELMHDLKGESQTKGHVHFIGAGPGDPELLPLKARKILHEADVVLHDRLVAPQILELARREAKILEVGKTPFGPSWTQEDINSHLVEDGKTLQVVRLKSGDCGIFGRLNEETDALDAAGIGYSITPGITAAAAAAAELKQSLTQRGHTSELRIITGYDVNGYAEQDWRRLARPDAVAAIYMGKAAAMFMRGRLLMHGADPATPITIVENVSRSDQRIIPASLTTLCEQIKDVTGPAVLMLGLHPKTAFCSKLQEAL